MTIDTSIEPDLPNGAPEHPSPFLARRLDTDTDFSNE